MGKIKKILGVLILILSIISVGSSIYALVLLKGIETFYRVMFMILLVLLLITLGFSIIDGIKNNKNVKLIISSILTLLLMVISIVITVIIMTVYQKLDSMNKTELKYKTALISLETKGKLKDLTGQKIGIIKNDEDIEGYILPSEVINKENLKDKNEIIEYDDTISLMNAFLQKEVDLIFISSNYNGMLKNIEGYDKDTEIHEVYTYEKAYQKDEVEENITPTTDKITDPFTILLLGVDSDEDSMEASTSFNGDTIMLISIDPETLHATMFSIPRDTYVPMACGGNQTKITHAAWGGTNCMVKTVENFTGLKVDYYVKINFRGVVDLVDKIGGITVDVPMDFCESNSYRWEGDWEICLNKGVQTLNGEQALALSRHRKSLPLGDFQRGQNQQLVVEALLDKLKTLRNVNDFYAVLDTISKNIDTNMSTDLMLSFYNVGKNILLKDEDVEINITKTFLTGYDLYVYEGYAETYTFQYYRQSLDEIIKAMKETLRQTDPEIIKTFNFSINSPYEKKVVGWTYYTNEGRKGLMPDFTAFSLSDAEYWCRDYGYTLIINEIESDDENYYDGQIINQSVHSGVLLEKAPNEITLDVIKKVDKSLEEEPTEPDESKGEEEPKDTPEDPKEPTGPSEGTEEPTEPGEEENNNGETEGEEQKEPTPEVTPEETDNPDLTE